MKLNDLKKKTVKATLPICMKKEVTFKSLNYRTDEQGNINGIFVEVAEYRSLFLPFFEDGNNFELDNLLEQLGVDTYDPEEINKTAGTKIIVSKVERKKDKDIFENVSFNPNIKRVENTGEVIELA